MTRAAWIDIARSLGDLRARLSDKNRIIGVDLAARVICSTLRARSKRFDSRRFMRIVLSSK